MTGYVINKGIHRAIEFKGLQAQYIGWVGAVVVVLLALYGILYAAGLSAYLCVPVVLTLGGFALAKVYRLSKRFGQYGMMKWRAGRRLPNAIRCRSGKVFISINKGYGNGLG